MNSPHIDRCQFRPGCEKPAFYIWRGTKETARLCQEHGELLAGNFKWELTRIYKSEKKQ